MSLGITSNPGSPQLPSKEVGCSHPPGQLPHALTHFVFVLIRHSRMLTYTQAHAHTVAQARGPPQTHRALWGWTRTSGGHTHTCMSPSSCTLSSLSSAVTSAFIHFISSLATEKHTSPLTPSGSLLGRQPDLIHVHRDQKAHSFPLHPVFFPCPLALSVAGTMVGTWCRPVTPCLRRHHFFPSQARSFSCGHSPLLHSPRMLALLARSHPNASSVYANPHFLLLGT